METFAAQAREGFVARSIIFLKQDYADWSAAKHDAEIDAFVRDLMMLGERWGVSSEANLRKLMHCRIALGLEDNPPEHVRFRLTEPNVSEDNRVEGACNVLLTQSQNLRVLERG